MIRWYAPKDPKWFYRVRIIAPDGRFQGEDIVGGITLATAKFEAKKASDMGMLVAIFSDKLMPLSLRVKKVRRYG